MSSKTVTLQTIAEYNRRRPILVHRTRRFIVSLEYLYDNLGGGDRIRDTGLQKKKKKRSPPLGTVHARATQLYNMTYGRVHV